MNEVANAIDHLPDDQQVFAISIAVAAIVLIDVTQEIKTTFLFVKVSYLKY